MANDDYFDQDYTGMTLFDLWNEFMSYNDSGIRTAMSTNPVVIKKISEIHEWAIPEELLEVRSVVFDQFISEARERWSNGVKLYRGGDESAPFNGDPLQEAVEESIDLYCYIKESSDQGLLSEAEADQLSCHAFDSYKLIKRIQKSMSDKLVNILGDQG